MSRPLSLRLADEYTLLAKERDHWRTAYTRLHDAIQALKKRDGYGELEQDLVAILDSDGAMDGA